MEDLGRQRKIIHIDMDYFYAQVEMLENPKLIDKPVVISGPPNSRSVVCTCSYKAREYGIKAGIPAFKAYELCKDAIFITPNMKKYSEVSKKMHAIFKQYTDLIEPLSLDEAFLDVTINKKGIRSATHVAQMIQNEIYYRLKLTCSAGVSYNKFLAKVASDYKKPSGITVVEPKDALEFIENLDIRSFMGVGKKAIKKFYDHGIYTGKDLKKLSKEDCEKYFSKLGLTLYENVRGRDSRELVVSRIQKSIGCEHTFEQNLKTREEIKRILSNITQESHERLKKSNKLTKTITIKIKFDDFTQLTRSKSFKYPISGYTDMLKIVDQLLLDVDLQGKEVRLMGVSSSNLIDRSDIKNYIKIEQIYLNLFNYKRK